MGGPARKLRQVRPVGEQTSLVDEFTQRVDRRQPIPGRKLDDRAPVLQMREVSAVEHERLDVVAFQCREGHVEIGWPGHLHPVEPHERAGRRVHLLERDRRVGVSRFQEGAHPGYFRNDLLHQFQPLAFQFQRQRRNASDVTAGLVTMPARTGSPTVPITTGIVFVARLAASAAAVPQDVKMTSTLR